MKYVLCTFVVLLATCSFALNAHAEDAASKPMKKADIKEAVAKKVGEEITVLLTPHTAAKRRRMGWSPKGFSVALIGEDSGLNGEIKIGLKGSKPVAVRLFKNEDSEHYDRLWVDLNRDGKQAKAEVLETKVSESRGKLWSSFSTEIDIPVQGNKIDSRIYGMNLWFVANPKEPGEKPVLRWSRNGWHQGTVKIGETTAHILIAEGQLDGVFTKRDAWAISENSRAIFGIKSMRRLGDHGWLGEQAYRVVKLDPNGLEITIQAFDPGITFQEELEKRDPFAADKKAKRAVKPLAFSHDFKKAQAEAKSQKKPLFIDFEATWCGPCKKMDQLVYTAQDVVNAAKKSGVITVKVDVDEHPELAKQFKVKGMPTMIMVSESGEEVRRAIGYRSVKAMTKFLGK